MKKSTFDAFKRLLTYAKPYRYLLYLAVLCTILSVAFNTLWPYILGLGITEITNNLQAGVSVNFSYVGKIVLINLLFAIFYQITLFFSGYLMTIVVQNMMRDLRSELDLKINRLPVAYFDKNKQGNILSRITNDVDAISNALQESVIQILIAILSIVMAIVMMFFINFYMAILALIMLPASVWLSKTIVKYSQKHFQAQQNTLGELNGYAQENYTGFTVLKLYGKEKEAVKNFKQINGKLANASFKAAFLAGLMMPLVGLTANLTYAGIAVLGGYFVIHGITTLGNLQAFIQYVWQINQPMSQMTQLSAVMQSASAATNRVFEILNEPSEVLEQNPESLPQKITGHVKFEQVQFGYNQATPLLKNLDFEVQSGQTVAIVGPTGAGKTTLINLLMRFYDVDKGAIKIDGVDTKKMKRQDVRSLFGMVLQDAWLYHDTIAENIRFGKLTASEYEIVDAAKAANVDHFIRTLPDGYDMILNEETSNISLGQKQLLTIARAIVADPKILILDEATSSVDTRLELLIQKAMHKIMKGRTSFVIAHRLSTIKDADLILVMNHGEIIEKGTHESLLAEKGFYQKLYQSQFAEAADYEEV